MSKRTLLRILDVCASSVRKSLQELDNVSAQGSNAFEDLYEVIDTVANHTVNHKFGQRSKAEASIE